MTLRIQKRDHRLLRTIAGHQVLTSLQIAKLCDGNLRAVQRRLQALVGEEEKERLEVGDDEDSDEEYEESGCA